MTIESKHGSVETRRITVAGHTLPPIKFKSIDLPAGEPDLELGKTFLNYILPRKELDRLNRDLTSQEAALKAALEATGPGRDCYPVLKGMAPAVSIWRRYVGLQKSTTFAPWLLHELEHFKKHEKVVIVCQHKDTIEDLRLRLAPLKPVSFYPQTPTAKRDRYIDRFKNRVSCRAAIGYVGAMLPPIELTKAARVYFVEANWVRPEENVQALMRVYLEGQERQVAVRFIGLQNSVDAMVMRAMKRKTFQLLGLFADS